jgi:hypothetical protein
VKPLKVNVRIVFITPADLSFIIEMHTLL